MQQVGHQQGGEGSAARTAIAARFAPAQLPTPVRNGQARALIALKRNWVLHRTLMVRLIAATLVALVLAGGFQARGGIEQAALTTGDLLAGRFAQAGFGIEEIAITGQVMARESDITAALGINGTTNIFNFDAQAARLALLELPAIADAQVRKVYPSRLVVEISEVTPVARWRVDGVTFVIDAAGVQIGDATAADDGLPLMIGDGAADDAEVLIKALARFPELNRGLLAMSRIADRRWDLIYDTGLRVQLPERGLGRALENLSTAQAGQQLLDRDLLLIDLRVQGMMALQLAQREED